MSGYMFFLFDPFWGTKSLKGTITFRRTDSHQPDGSMTPPSSVRSTKPVSVQKPKPRKERKPGLWMHPAKRGWYVFAACLSACAAFLALFIGPYGLPLSLFFALGVWANIANLRKYYPCTPKA